MSEAFVIGQSQGRENRSSLERHMIFNKGKVTIEVFNVLARITPGDVAALLAPKLIVTSTQFQTGGALGYLQRCRKELLYRRDQDGALWVPAGLTYELMGTLHTAGYQVAIERFIQLDERARPNAQMLEAASGKPRALLELIDRDPKGLFEVRRDEDVFHWAAMICRLFPLARILFAMNGSRKRVEGFRRGLEDAGAFLVHTFHDYRWPLHGGRVICRLGDLNTITQHKDSLFDVVVIPDALQVLPPRYIETLARLNQHRVYGFVKQHPPLSALNRIHLQAVLGPFLICNADPRGEPAAVRVLWVQPPWYASVPGVSTLERKRASYWRNDDRNDYIAAVARSLTIGDTEALWQLGLLLSERSNIAGADRGLAVSILVESVEHGRELHRRLPNWDLATKAPMPPGVGTVVTKNVWRVRALEKVIMTYREAVSLDEIDPHVLICAGPEWPFELEGFPLRSQDPACQAVVIDLADDFDRTARAAVRRRFRKYSARGWQSIGAPSWAVRNDDDAMAHRPRDRRGRVRHR